MRRLVRTGAIGFGLAIACTVAPLGARAEDLDPKVKALVGEWVYVQDRSTGPGLDPRMRPTMGRRFTAEVKDGALVLMQTRVSGPYASIFPLDGSEKVAQEKSGTRRTQGAFDGERFVTTDHLEATGKDGKPATHGQRVALTPTAGGLLVTLTYLTGPQVTRASLYKRSEDVPQATPFKAGLDVIAWLPGAWVGEHGKAAVEERWGPISGGALLGTAKTTAKVGDVERMVAYEFLRILEQEGTLIYVAQPNGGPATEFTLTEATATRVVFENPAHGYPKRIVYERQGEKGLTTEISDTGGSNPNRATYTREP
jgi:hypothetical protein